MLIRFTLVLTLALPLVSCGSGDPGLIDCAAYVDRLIECGIIPPENAAALREPNIKICNNWEKTYKEPVIEALAECIDVPCAENQTCAAAANQLCVSDVSAEIDLLCEKISECGWEEMTTMELCRDGLQSVQMLYMCLKPEILDDYIACVRAITCGPESEDEWYVCGAKHIQSY
jgi:hypothetical protein